jgi:dihydrofolate reductase
MKVVAYFTLSADGFLPRAEDKDIPPPETIYTDTEKRTKKLGGLIVGRTSYESMEEDESPVPLVVVSRTKRGDKDGVMFAQSPVNALQRLTREGISSAMVGGGAQLYSGFLAAGLIDELYVNIAPEILGKGLRIETARRHAQKLKLIRTSHLDEGIVQMHYRRT